MSCLTDLVKTEYYTSKWVACNPLPVQYKLTSDLFPINSVDGIESIISVANNGGYAELTLGSSYEVYQEKEYIKISDSTQTSYNGVWQILSIDIYGKITIDAPFVSTSTGELQRYYNNYHILVRVFAGIPLGHALETENPTELKDTLKVIPYTDNIAYVDVSSALRSEFPLILNEYCKRLQNDIDVNVNDWKLWTSFYIAYAESYDIVVNGEVVTYTSPYTYDLESGGSITELFTNPSFDSGLTGWTQSANYPPDAVFIAGTGQVEAVSTTENVTKKLGQTVAFQAGKSYTIKVDFVINNSIVAFFSVDDTIIYSSSFLTSNSMIYTYSPTEDISGMLSVWFTLTREQIPSSYVHVTSFSCLGDSSNLNIYYAVNGTQQFKYAQGNNMGEYVLNDNDLIAPTKFMTLFPTSSLWVGNEFDLSIIVPNDLLGTYDELNYKIDEYDSNGNLLDSNYVDFNYYDEGLYRIRLDNYAFDIDTAYFNIAIYLHNTNSNVYTRISEERKVVIEEITCKSETYLTWFNYLGAWEYFKFSAFKDYEFANGENKIIRRNIFNIWDTDFIQGDTQDDIISKADSFNFTLVRSQRLTLEQRNTIVNWLKRSIKAMKIESGEYDCITENNKRTIILNPDSFNAVESDKQYFIDFKYRDTNTIITQFQ